MKFVLGKNILPKVKKTIIHPRTVRPFILVGSIERTKTPAKSHIACFREIFINYS